MALIEHPGSQQIENDYGRLSLSLSLSLSLCLKGNGLISPSETLINPDVI